MKILQHPAYDKRQAPVTQKQQRFASQTMMVKAYVAVMLFVFTICLPSYGQDKNPFLTLKYDKAVFYDIEDAGGKENLVVDANGEALHTIIKKVELDKTVIKNLNFKLGDKRSYGGGSASCFDPHCGIVYYQNDKPVAQITICLLSNRLYSTHEITAQHQSQQISPKGYSIEFDGLSKSFRQYINNLLIKYRFHHRAKPGGNHDGI